MLDRCYVVLNYYIHPKSSNPYTTLPVFLPNTTNYGCSQFWEEFDMENLNQAPMAQKIKIEISLVSLHTAVTGGFESFLSEMVRTNSRVNIYQCDKYDKKFVVDDDYAIGLMKYHMIKMTFGVADITLSNAYKLLAVIRYTLDLTNLQLGNVAMVPMLLFELQTYTLTQINVIFEYASNNTGTS